MGCFPSKKDPDAEHSRKIDRSIKNDEKRLAKEVKILLLGAGESGKTTILKQMKLIHAAGFSNSERETYRTIIFSNILSSLRLVLEAMVEFNIQLQVASNADYFDLITSERELGRREVFPPEYLTPFKDLWADSGVQAAFQRGHEYALHDNLSYFLASIDRLFQPNYIPSDQDILRCRMKTTGITETLFHLGDLDYRMFDVGGQRSERKKWIHCFENVTALMFLVAISGYDQCLVEDRDNQMREALMLFESICNSQWFINTSIILFLNKIDLFREKILVSPIRAHFEGFTGDEKNFDDAATFFQQQFVQLNRNPTKDIYSHFTNATDTTLLKNVFSSVTDIIVQRSLHELIL